MVSEKMDAVTEFSEKVGFKVEKFLLAGASKVWYLKNIEIVKINLLFIFIFWKRGWATWTTAAVDKRVIIAVPIVMVIYFNWILIYDLIKYNTFFINF